MVGGEVHVEGMVEKSVILLHWQPKLAWYLGSGDHTVDSMHTIYILLEISIRMVDYLLQQWSCLVNS